MAEEEIGLEEIELDAEDRMQKSLDIFKRDMAAIRSSRASASMVEHLMVECYGTQVPLQQVASLAVPEARMIVITPFDRNVTSDIEKTLLKSDLGLTPQTDGAVIRLILPELSMDRRQELAKQLGRRLEEARVSVRNVRREANDQVKKLKGHSEDDIKGTQERIQKLTDRFIGSAESAAQAKEKEILSV